MTTPSDDIPYFGGCPTCGRTDGCVNYGSEHWFVCRRHRTRWSPGSNLFSGWRDEDPVHQIAFWWTVGDFTIVEPILPHDAVTEISETARLASEIEDLRVQLAEARYFKPSPYDQPADVLAALTDLLRGWPTARWLELAKMIKQQATSFGSRS